MASMGFDQETLRLILNIAEDRMGTDLSESDYIKICNAMKELSDRGRQEPPQHTPPEHPDMIRFVTNRTTPERSPFYGNPEVQAIIDRINHYRGVVQNHKENLMAVQATTYSVTVMDKQKVIERLLPEEISRGSRGGVKKMNMRMVASHISQILTSNLVGRNELHKMIEEEMETRRAKDLENYESILRDWIMRLEEQCDMLSNMPGR
jgi:hypothetical protein